ncbi:MAG: TPM domain-containing protein [Clostridia bacterium]|nr:TPM domain-containing protein [Clostridia bacterium]
MKRKCFIFSLILVCIMLITFQSVYASTNTTERTEENLQIWNSIKINSTVKRAALATPKVDETEKIYDFADLFTEFEEKNLFSDVTEFIHQYKMDMVIVTIDENNKSSAKAYADDFYDYNYFGVGSTYDGILLLIDMDNRIVWISTTGNGQIIYDDARIDNILDYVQEELIDANYYSAADDFIYYSSKYAKSGVPSSNSNMKVDDEGNYVQKGKLEFNSFADVMYFVMGIALLPTLATVIIILIGVASHRNVKKSTSARSYLNVGSINIGLRTDQFLRTSTTSTRISSSSSSGGGGSSIHHSSSGRSHGGGGRRF